ncbi:MAG: hypothetical protein AAF386_00585 [Pseudomonadota bacterium]
MELSGFADRGWAVFPPEPAVQDWVDAVAPTAMALADDPNRLAEWVRHQATWFVGVNALPNGPDGQVGAGPPLAGTARAALDGLYGALPLEPAQVSAIYRGYPKQDPDESDANHRFRLVRDAAHVDGLLPVGPDKRRKLIEPHAFVLGIPLNATSADAGPMVVWDGSHRIMADAFAKAFADIHPDDMSDTDLTDVYQAARRTCFDRCKRVVVHVPLGGSYIIHRLALHGVAPWPDHVDGPTVGRIIAYFRPECPGGVAQWLAMAP